MHNKTCPSDFVIYVLIGIFVDCRPNQRIEWNKIKWKRIGTNIVPSNIGDDVSFVGNVYMQIYLNLIQQQCELQCRAPVIRVVYFEIQPFVELLLLLLWTRTTVYEIAITIATADQSGWFVWLCCSRSLYLLIHLLLVFRSQSFPRFGLCNRTSTEQERVHVVKEFCVPCSNMAHCTYERTHENKQWKIAGSQKQFHLENFRNAAACICLFACLLGLHFMYVDICGCLCILYFVFCASCIARTTWDCSLHHSSDGTFSRLCAKQSGK